MIKLHLKDGSVVYIEKDQIQMLEHKCNGLFSNHEYRIFLKSFPPLNVDEDEFNKLLRRIGFEYV